MNISHDLAYDTTTWWGGTHIAQSILVNEGGKSESAEHMHTQYNSIDLQMNLEDHSRRTKTCIDHCSVISYISIDLSQNKKFNENMPWDICLRQSQVCEKLEAMFCT